MSFWPYTVLEKSRVYQWVRAIVLLIGAPGLGVWLLATGQCKRWHEYAMAVSVLTIGLLFWITVLAVVIRRVRTGKWIRE